jgi:hypothetical protein
MNCGGDQTATRKATQMADETEFLSRWSKRKAESRDASKGEAPEADAGSDSDPQLASLEAEDGEQFDPDDPDDHPAAGIDVESLDFNSDYSVFMHEKVPEALRKRALRKLWLSDPILANVDGLNDYDEDFTDAALVVEGLKQSFDAARKRMLDQEAEEAAAAEAAAQEDAADLEDAEEVQEDGDAPDTDAEEKEPQEGDDLVADATDLSDEDLQDDDDAKA